MDICLWDLLWEFCFRHHPCLLDDEEAFRNLHDLIHLLLEKQRREQNALLQDRIERMTRGSRN